MDKQLYLAQAQLFRKYGETMNHLHQMENGLEVLLDMLYAICRRETLPDRNQLPGSKEIDALLLECGLSDIQLSEQIDQARKDHKELAFRFFRDHGDNLDRPAGVESVLKRMDTMNGRVIQANYAVFDTVHILLNRYGEMLSLKDFQQQTNDMHEATHYPVNKRVEPASGKNIIPLHPDSPTGK